MLEPGTTIGRYEVLDFLGKGGMGEVYRARDLTLNRIVAIKTIRRRDADNPESRLRFDQERRLAATLEHPHICRILDAGSTDGTDYIVMEFLEGESLAHRITAGSLPHRELLGYAIEIASALQYAHGRGIIHRDLKPGNVFLTKTGVKLLDFGLAISVPLVAPASTDDPELRSTALMAATAEGTIVGTAEYLAPERLEGQKADHRSDIWAFGLVMYEMASGRRAFEASTPARQIAAILEREPPPLDPGGPGGTQLDWVIRKCLEKDPDERWQAAGDIGTVLRRLAGDGRITAPPAPSRRWFRAVPVQAALAAALLTGAALAWMLMPARGAPAEPVALEIAPPLGSAFTLTQGSVQTAQLAVSPDGRSLAFIADDANGAPQLWIRSLDSVIARPLPGTTGATFPFWAPDSRSVAFFARGVLKRVDVTGAPPQILAAATNGRGGAWNPDDVILFAAGTNAGLSRVDASGGGPATPQTTLREDNRETSHRWPHFLPDGRRFIYFARSSDLLKEGIYLGSLDSAEPKMIVQTSYGGLFAPPDHLLYVADQSLVARRFDVARGKLTGAGTVVADTVGVSSNFYAAASVSSNGLLAYAPSAAAAELAWIDRDGKRLGLLAPRGRYVDFQLSPDGLRTAVAAVEHGRENADIHLIEIATSATTRLTAGRSTDASPVWSPDGRWILFRSNRNKVHELYKRASAGPGEEELFLGGDSGLYPTDWSTDGRTILYQTRGAESSGWDIWSVRWDNPAERRPLVATPSNDVQGRLSPDGRWIAYASNQSRVWEIYVESVAQPEQRWQVSSGGASDPRWRADGKELFYISDQGWLMSAAVPGRGGMPVGPEVRLFEFAGSPHVPPYLSAYDVAPDGSRFLMRLTLESARSTPLVAIANWSPGDR